MLIMHSKRAIAIFLALIFSVIPAAGETHTRDEVRARYAQLDIDTSVSPYGEIPCIDGAYTPGSVSDAAAQDAAEYVEFIRYLAYLDGEIAVEPVYAMRAQHGAVLLAVNGDLSHDPPRAEGMSDGFYNTARSGTMSSNIAAINWMDGDILIASVEYFVRDDGEANLGVLGHRRWLLSPYLGKTGFGLANSASGMSYTAMYVHDDSAECEDWSNIKWPSEGAFPADLTSYDIPWSVTLNPDVYSGDFSSVTVDMYEKTAGRAQLSYFGVNTESYGAGPCIIFMPELAEMGLTDYQQNQVWYVRIDGLKYADGSAASIEYVVEMMSLYPIDPAAVEVDPRALSMDVGDICCLDAQVVPGWADDVTVKWYSTDESVAVVDENGYVTALAPGECTIVAEAVNGRCDECSVTVE